MIQLKKDNTLEWDFANMSVIEATDIFREIVEYVDTKQNEPIELPESKYFKFWENVNKEKTVQDYVIYSFNSLIKKSMNK